MERTKKAQEYSKGHQEGKKIYMSYKIPYMCHCFMIVDYDKYGRPEKISEIIPEFKPETFNANKPYHYPWWNPIDREPRIKALNKLIEIYSK
jgi:hypothetical protein